MYTPAIDNAEPAASDRATECTITFTLPTGRVNASLAWLVTMLATALLLGTVATAFAQGAEQVGAPASAHPAVGTWEGAIEIPGSPLGVVVRLELAGEDWTGDIDIPVQGAMGMPLDEISVVEDTVLFRIAGVPGEPTFRGVVEADSLVGTFSQGGQEFPFTLTRAGSALSEGAEGAPRSTPPAAGEVPAGPAVEAPGGAEEYVDPEGRFTIPLPAGWTVTDQGGYVTITGPEGGIRVAVVVGDAEDPGAAVAAAWELTAPEVDIEPFQTLEPPSEPGVDRTLVMNYDTGDAEEIYQAVAQVVGEETYILLISGELGAVQRRNAQLQVVASGFAISGVEEVDLSGAEARAVSEVVGELEEFVVAAMADFGIPGVSIAIVEGDEVAYLAGFGFTAAGGDEQVTPATHMMIGSTGKTMTSMLVATLVDDGIIDWDTPVVEVLPNFAVADEQLSEEITIRNLLCACTGVPRRDLELLFNYDELSAEGVIESLRTFEFFTAFGEAFQYSNQLVATAGFAAAAAAGAAYGELSEGYRQALNERVLEPIGMTHTTLDFDAVLARDRYARPHQLELDSGEYEPISLELERLLTPVGPAGAHWSTAEDMARYLMTQLNVGVAPDGARVVSEENLRVTWQPQVPLSASESYGLGWIVGQYNGLKWLYHGGNTLGFTSEFVFLPGADLGITVLANAQAANAFTGAVTRRLLELVYDQPAAIVEQTDFQVEQLQTVIAERGQRLQERVPLSDALDFFGTYVNPALGAVSLRIEDGQLLLDAGEWTTQIRPFLDREGQPDDYVTYGAPLSGLGVRFETGDDGTTTMVLGEGAVSYTFERAR